MATPMASNLKILSDASSRTVDAMMYCQMIESLMYIYLLCFEHLEPILDKFDTFSLDYCKAYFEVPEGYN